jgi:hypothetical protein
VIWTKGSSPWWYNWTGYSVRFEILTALLLRYQVFSDLTQCQWVCSSWHFEGSSGKAVQNSQHGWRYSNTHIQSQWLADVQSSWWANKRTCERGRVWWCGPGKGLSSDIQHHTYILPHCLLCWKFFLDCLTITDKGTKIQLVQPADITHMQYTKRRLLSASWGWASNARNMYRPLILNKLNKKCITSVLLYWCHILKNWKFSSCNLQLNGKSCQTARPWKWSRHCDPLNI